MPPLMRMLLVTAAAAAALVLFAVQSSASSPGDWEDRMKALEAKNSELEEWLAALQATVQEVLVAKEGAKGAPTEDSQLAVVREMRTNNAVVEAVGSARKLLQLTIDQRVTALEKKIGTVSQMTSDWKGRLCLGDICFSPNAGNLKIEDRYGSLLAQLSTAGFNYPGSPTTRPSFYFAGWVIPYITCYGYWNPTVPLMLTTMPAGMRAVASSSALYSSPSYLVDKSHSTVFTSADTDPAPWVAIKLNSTAHIYHIAMYFNRPEYIANSEVRVGTTPVTAATLTQNPVVWRQRGPSSGFTNGIAVMFFNQPAVGNWISFQNFNSVAGQYAIVMREIDVWYMQYPCY